MSVVIEAVDLTPQQVRTLSQLTWNTHCLIEQIKDYGANRVTTRTFVRCGIGKNKREWLLLRNGKAIPNSTAGSGTPKLR